MVSALVLATLLQISVKAARAILRERRFRMAATADRVRKANQIAWTKKRQKFRRR